MKKYKNVIKDLFFIVLICILAFITAETAFYQHNQPQLRELKSELKTKNEQIDGLHNQLRRTQYQLKKAREQNVEQTAKIAELTGNGG